MLNNMKLFFLGGAKEVNMSNIIRFTKCIPPRFLGEVAFFSDPFGARSKFHIEFQREDFPRVHHTVIQVP